MAAVGPKPADTAGVLMSTTDGGNIAADVIATASGLTRPGTCAAVAGTGNEAVPFSIG